MSQESFKMPSDYDFSTRGKDWSDYSKDFILRTDAVWEKQKLRDYWRLYTKCFYFNKALKKYQVIEPEDTFSIIFDGMNLEDVTTYLGFTPTGRTNAFQASIGPKQRVQTSVQTNFSKQDYYDLCALRFDKWNRCDMAFYDLRDKKFDYVIDQKNYKNYPCFREFYEAQYACQDDLFDFLMELSYSRQANDLFEEDVSRHEFQMFPTVLDSPKYNEKRTMTY